jgi:hypothetical protein
MIVGTIYLITILFGSGLIDTFFIAELEKGVKIYVQDKDRKNELRADIKDTRQYIKAFNKSRKARLKQYKKILVSRETTAEELDDFYDLVSADRKIFQNKLIDDRLELARNLSTDEWSSIIALSFETMEERRAKAQKKTQKRAEKNVPEKTKDRFKKTRKVLAKKLDDGPQQDQINDELNKLVAAMDHLETEIRAINVTDDSTVIRQEASRKDLNSLANKMNDVRLSSYEMLKEFHFSVLNNTNEEKFEMIMKTFSKELETSVR